jgi:hypothetical protein
LGGAHEGFGEAYLKNKGLRGANLEYKGFGEANLIKKPLLTKKKVDKRFYKGFSGPEVATGNHRGGPVAAALALAVLTLPVQ